MRLARTGWWLLAAALLVLQGCAVNRATANVDPGANLASLKRMHVVRVKDDDQVYQLIADKLGAQGVAVTSGWDKPKDVDAIVTYLDKWHWDITMYLLELTVVVRDPASEFPIATANSLHTSLTRKSPKEMVDEVVDNIYKGGKK